MTARHGPFSVYAPEPQPWLRPPSCTHSAQDGCRRCEGDYPTIGPDWDPHTVLARYVEAAAAGGAQWAIDQLAANTAPDQEGSAA